MVYHSNKMLLTLAKRFQRRRFKCEKLTEDGCQVMGKAHMAFGQVSEQMERVSRWLVTEVTMLVKAIYRHIFMVYILYGCLVNFSHICQYRTTDTKVNSHSFSVFQPTMNFISIFKKSRLNHNPEYI
jgi:hypothetical protein